MIQILNRAAARRCFALIAALFMVLVSISAVSVATAPRAEAASDYGAGGYWSPYGGWVGSFYNPVTKTWVFCVDHWTLEDGSGGEGALRDIIDPRAGGNIGGTRTISGDELRKLNYAITVHGQTDDDLTGAAVAAYVWSFTSTRDYGNGLAYVAGPHEAQIRALYEQIKADTEANFDLPGPTGTVEMSMTTDPENHYLGTLEVRNMDPVNARGTLMLRNGVFADTGLAIRDGVTNNSVFDIVAVPPEDGGSFKVAVEAAFRGTGNPSFASSVRLHSDTGQRTAGPGVSFDGAAEFEVHSEDPESRDVAFLPVVQTQVTTRVAVEGEQLADVVTFSTVSDSAGVNNLWYRNTKGEYAHIKATATIYGPFSAQPQELAQPPADAPVAASGIEIETSPVQGPTEPYTVQSGFTPSEAGYYTWVWNIEARLQDDGVQAFLPDGYSYTDRFGQVTETTIVPTKLQISTQVTTAEVGLDQAVADEVVVTPLNGRWLQSGGQSVPAVLTGRAYWSEVEPERSQGPPPEAELLGEMTLVVTDSEPLLSDSIRMPLRPGYVTFQWCLHEHLQPAETRGLIAETCDDYGQPSETSRVVAPVVTTEAVGSAEPNEEIFDTAIINGLVPERSMLKFELFKKPEVGDWKHGVEEESDASVWSEADVNELSQDAICVPENRVAQTEAVAVDAGQHDGSQHVSPGVVVDRPGTYWWVESLVVEHPESGEHTVIHTGICGLENETTVVVEPVEVVEPEEVVDPVEPVVTKPPASSSPLAVTGSPAGLRAWVVPTTAGTTMVGALLMGFGALLKKRGTQDEE